MTTKAELEALGRQFAALIGCEYRVCQRVGAGWRDDMLGHRCWKGRRDMADALRVAIEAIRLVLPPDARRLATLPD